MLVDLDNDLFLIRAGSIERIISDGMNISNHSLDLSRLKNSILDSNLGSALFIDGNSRNIIPLREVPEEVETQKPDSCSHNERRSRVGQDSVFLPSVDSSRA